MDIDTNVYYLYIFFFNTFIHTHIYIYNKIYKITHIYTYESRFFCYVSSDTCGFPLFTCVAFMMRNTYQAVYNPE